MVQHNLFLAYILSIKPISGIHFVHSNYYWPLLRLNITYSWHTFCQSVKPVFFRTKKKFLNELIVRLLWAFSSLTLPHQSLLLLSASLICLCSWVAHIANNMDPDQAAPKGAVWSGSIVFASMRNSSLKWTWVNAADVKSRLHFQYKNAGRIRI